ncbi:arylsulfatase A family protein [Xenococcus sp. PCC 7305]|uniref:sulfatase-like hydrolase/transferase n=1 Tax=Xenococcus sp. PCC 7305 TaxID=102125 RepID=UPI0002ACD5BB|nr:sulfatase-like hydrolase/transferase [Xenococcus sp. PCC 7305]ELS00993.1 arylsulfatase A family protein [Xenococcus sp. PCC 7305]
MAFPEFKRPNIIILISDQQRAIQHFPEEWVKNNLPNLNRLKQTGITFRNAQTSTCACSPSRATLWTGMYPSTNGVYKVPGTLKPNPRNKTNIVGNVLKKAGYRVIYKGKWDLSDSTFDQPSKETPRLKTLTSEQQQTLQAEDAAMLTNWQLDGWLAPDSGTSITDREHGLNTLGGSSANNDGRYVNGPSLLSSQQTAIEFLSQNQNPEQPFCLIVSLVGPHDVWVYPEVFNQGLTTFPSAFQNYQGFTLPQSYYQDDLTTKPWAQSNFLNREGGKLSEEDALNYVKFYAYLHTLTDSHFGHVLDATSDSLWDNTILVRLADHGEMGMAHNGLTEKQNTVYREAINVPLIFSNPKWIKQGIELDSLVSSVDLLPTLAAIAGLTKEQQQEFEFQGIDFSQTLLDPSHPTQDALLFSYDDGVNDTSVAPPGDKNAIRCLRTAEWKYAVYYASPGNDGQIVTSNGFQYELYNLQNDPLELTNLLPVGGIASEEAKTEQKKLHQLLTYKMKETKTMPQNWPTTV